MNHYTFPSDTRLQQIFINNNNKIIFDRYYYTNLKYIKICNEADIIYFETIKDTIDINILCKMEEYLNNKLNILIYTKIYTYNDKEKQYEYFYSEEINKKIKKVKQCIKYIKKIK
jgi:hypothetical protein